MTDGSSQTPPPPPPPQQTPPPPPGQTPPPAPAATYTPGGAPQKKGLSPLAWVGIGCGVIVLDRGRRPDRRRALGRRQGEGVLRQPGDGHRQDHRAGEPGAGAGGLGRRGRHPDRPQHEDRRGGDRRRRRRSRTAASPSATRRGRRPGSAWRTGRTARGPSRSATRRARDLPDRGRRGAGHPRLGAALPRGAAIQGSMATASDGKVQGGFSFETDDSLEDVLAYYADEMADAGMEQTGGATTRPATPGC